MNRRPWALTTLLILGTAAAIAGATTITTETTAFGHHLAAASSHVAAGHTAPSAPASAAGTPSVQVAPGESAAAGPSPSRDPSDLPSLRPAPGTTGVAPVSDESSRVGALYSGSAPSGNHFCTASVVHSGSKNLLLTAAHCASNTDNLYFAPGYRNGQSPFGTWQVTKLYQTTGWTQNGNQDEDFAILQVAQNNGRSIEDVVGANNLALNVDFGARVRLYGYPANTEEPILCTNDTTKQSDHQRRIDCPSFPGGTSGGPWIDTDTDKVIGVIGGYQQGGDTDDTSYSATFEKAVGDLYNQAAADST
ncbi:MULTISPECIES: trypsin-like serine peptidase [Kitasatospora]|uniref:Trypsin-like peptidase domain-containing protein n=1 Tax=Kitasatospora cystarginea TaxID=58350 RepID=A0ABN3EQE7_9ACTN